MNPEKLAKLQKMNSNRIGGKGTMRRKKKVVQKSSGGDDKKLQSALKKLSVNPIPGIEEVNMFKNDGNVLHFTQPKVQAAIAANTFAITGSAENKPLTELMPGILNQLGQDSLPALQKLAAQLGAGAGGAGVPGAGVGAAAAGGDSDDDDMPELTENFDEAAKA